VKTVAVVVAGATLISSVALVSSSADGTHREERAVRAIPVELSLTMPVTTGSWGWAGLTRLKLGLSSLGTWRNCLNELIIANRLIGPLEVTLSLV
jgi:hypothetical protein